MQTLYFSLVALHMVAVVVTGMLWTLLDLGHWSKLRPHLRDIRAVHFGSLYLVPWFLGLAYAFEKLQVPAWHQAVFPLGLGALVFFSGIAYLFPRQPGLDPFYYWTRGRPMLFSMIGLACLIIALLWTGTVLVVYARCPGRITQYSNIQLSMHRTLDSSHTIRRAIYSPVRPIQGCHLRQQAVASWWSDASLRSVQALREPHSRTLLGRYLATIPACGSWPRKYVEPLLDAAESPHRPGVPLV